MRLVQLTAFASLLLTSAGAALAASCSPSNATDLKTCLNQVNPGDTITLRSGVTYTGHFTLTRDGSTSSPITITGPASAILDGGDYTGYTLYLNGANYIRVTGITINHGQKGVMLDGSSHNTFDGITVKNTGQEVFHFRYNSAYNTLKNSTIENSGRTGSSSDTTDWGYGEGVYVGSAVSNWKNGQPDASSHNIITGNHITNTTAECMDIKEGTTYTVVTNNSLNGYGIKGVHDADSFIDVKGSNATISDNTASISPANTAVNSGFSVHTISAAGTGGQNNYLSGNHIDLNGGSGNGWGFYVFSGSTGSTTVCSNNTVLGETKSNIGTTSCN